MAKKMLLLGLGAILLAGVIILVLSIQAQPSHKSALTAETLKLPTPIYTDKMSVEEALLTRRSQRDYSPEALTLAEVAQLLWAAQGITHPAGLRTAPSAGALYPLEVYLLAGEVEGLEAGVYRYLPDEHGLALVREGDQREALYQAALRQESVREGKIAIVLTGIYARTTGKYGKRGIQYVHMEAGSTAQNVYLQATALGLGTVLIGAFHDDQVRVALGLAEDEVPLAVMPVGRP